MIALTKRNHPSWIEGFLDYSSNLPSPDLFRKWTAISIISAAVERKIWVTTMGRKLYPTLYILLVGPAGVGKTVCTSRAQEFIKELKTHHVAPSTVSRASLMDDLKLATRDLITPRLSPPTLSFNSLYVAANEFGVLVPAYDNDFMNTLTDVYDGHPYSEKKRTKDLNMVIKAPQLNLLAATTPSYLNGILPEGAWEQGFISRTLLIYSGETHKVSLFGEEVDYGPQEAKLIEDLKRIANLVGAYEFTPEAKTLINDWHMKDGPPRPDHPKLWTYGTRRTAQLLKLCLIEAASTSDDLLITKDIFQRALDNLIEAEVYMADIFKAMRSGGDSSVMENAWHFVYEHCAKKREPMTAQRLIHFVQERTPAHNVERLIQVMCKAGMLQLVIMPGNIQGYKALPKTIR